LILSEKSLASKLTLVLSRAAQLNTSLSTSFGQQLQQHSVIAVGDVSRSLDGAAGVDASGRHLSQSQPHSQPQSDCDCEGLCLELRETRERDELSQRQLLDLREELALLREENGRCSQIAVSE
jgi:hypothetical protein